MSEREMTTIVLNAVLEEQGKFTSSIYGKKESIPFNEIWSLCKIEETRFKAKSDVGPSEQVQAFVAMARRKGKFGKFGPQKKKKMDMSKIQRYGCQKYGHFKRDCLKLKKDNKKRKEGNEAHVTEEVEEPEKKK